MRQHRLRRVLSKLLLRRRCGRLFATAGLLPVLILAPLGAGTIVIHEHHDEELHTHRAIGSGATGERSLARLPLEGHDHHHDDETGEGADLVLVVPDLHRLTTGSASDLQVRSTSVRTGFAWAIQARLATEKPDPPADRGQARHPIRVADGLTSLLLTTNAILI